MQIGIDLGTTRTIVAIADRGNYPVVTFENAEGDFQEWYPCLVATRDGERRSKIQVVADAVQFLGSPKNAAQPDGGVAQSDDKPALGAYRRKAS